jgi:rhamnose utilization protein RhaD (predicted bifunctional aldolase and dehydrogenase)/NAD(P)-dependent dehydrogenase (short-subunit alcohol dehydrogenase family)
MPEMDARTMVDYVTRCLVEPGARPSIEAQLHAYLPHIAVFHSHADRILALVDNERARELVRDVYGERAFLVPYRIPGHALAKVVADLAEAHPRAEGCLLMHHGLVTWGATAAAAYDKHLELVALSPVELGPVPGEERIADPSVATRLRGLLGGGIVLSDGSRSALEFASAGRDLAERGAATPDHMLQTKRVALVAAADDLPEAIDAYAARYQEYCRRHGPAGGFIKDPRPRVVLVPGHGLFAQGPDLRSARAALEIYQHTIGVMRGAESTGRYRSLDEGDAYEMEYFEPELDKLRLAPPPREFTGKVALVTGAGRGIGKAIADRLERDGAVVVRSDIAGAEIVIDVASETSVKKGFEAVCARYGGLDIVVSNAGILVTGAVESLSLEDWQRSFAVNATGHFLVCREALRVMRLQGLGGAIVLNVTKNVLAPGAEMAAYSAAKAAAAQLARVLAIEAGPLGVRVNMVHPDQVFTDLWTREARESRARAHGVPVAELEEFYRSRTLLKRGVTPEDVAEAVAFLASERSAKTTGNMLVVDAGAKESFPR